MQLHIFKFPKNNSSQNRKRNVIISRIQANRMFVNIMKGYTNGIDQLQEAAAKLVY